MIYKERPLEFNAKFSVVSCYVESGDDILLLHRHDNKPEGGTWGLPAGKIDEGETEIVAMTREIKEETGLIIREDQLEHVSKVYVKYPDYHFIYHSFRIVLADKPVITINLKEHQAYCWLNPLEALSLSLVPDLDTCIQDFYGQSI